VSGTQTIDAAVAAHLRAAGMHPVAADAAVAALAQATTALGGAPTHAWWVPGRIEVLGKHTDYAGGRSLVCATDLGLVAVARRDAQPRLRLRSVADDGMRETILPLRDQAVGHGWAAYPAAVVRRLVRHFGADTGVELAIAANLPAAAGMSSSSALVIATHTALAAIGGLAERPAWRAAIGDRADLVAYLGGHENGGGYKHLAGDAGVGTAGGSQDHAAIIGGRAGHLTLLRSRPPVVDDEVPLPAGQVLVVAVSGVVAEKTAAARDAYNRCARLASEALAAWNRVSGRSDPHLFAACTHAVDAQPQVLAALAATPELQRRAAQFAGESLDCVPTAAAALAHGDLAVFGRSVARSQAMAETMLGNQVPETSALVALALRHGASAASSFGAGFGGAVWALTSEDVAEDFGLRWLAAYHRDFPRRTGSVHVVHPGPGLLSLPVGIRT
jgi:galactokinase